jgi:hypothetical protein
MLPGKQRVGFGWKPPLPLILAAWSETSAAEKRVRLSEHLRYAAENGVLTEVETFVRSLAAKEWSYQDL